MEQPDMPTLTELQCKRCGNTFTPRRKDSIYCTKQCSREASRKPPITGNCDDCHKKLGDRRSKRCQVCAQRRLSGWNGSKEIALRTIQYRPQQPTKFEHTVTASRTFKAGRCFVCTEPFVSLNVDITCSAKCQTIHRSAKRRDSKQRRRAIQREAFVAPVYRYKIYERDEWTCKLCNEPISKTESYPSIWSASVDHILPLAKGGTHEPDNCQAVHFICNSIKSDRLEGVAGGLDVAPTASSRAARGVSLSAFLLGVPD